ncbi:MAG: VWA domain-containing protein, partial [Chthoniobacterales bacterium]
IELQLDYKTILRNSSRPVHLVTKLTAPAQPLTQRVRPTAFTVVLDRSGSMSGAPIEHAKRACREVIKNLRPEDYFSLVVFDDSAQVVIPLERPTNRFSWYQTVDQIQAGASTNLMAGWLLGRDSHEGPENRWRDRSDPQDPFAHGWVPQRRDYRAGPCRSVDKGRPGEGRDPDQLPRVRIRLQREYSRRDEQGRAGAVTRCRFAREIPGYPGG